MLWLPTPGGGGDGTQRAGSTSPCPNGSSTHACGAMGQQWHGRAPCPKGASAAVGLHYCPQSMPAGLPTQVLPQQALHAAHGLVGPTKLAGLEQKPANQRQPNEDGAIFVVRDRSKQAPSVNQPELRPLLNTKANNKIKKTSHHFEKPRDN